MKDDAVIKDNEAVYLLNEQTYLHLLENLQGVGYEVFDKNSPLPVEEADSTGSSGQHPAAHRDRPCVLSDRASG